MDDVVGSVEADGGLSSASGLLLILFLLATSVPEGDGGDGG